MTRTIQKRAGYLQRWRNESPDTFRLLIIGTKIIALALMPCLWALHEWYMFGHPGLWGVAFFVAFFGFCLTSIALVAHTIG